MEMVKEVHVLMELLSHGAHTIKGITTDEKFISAWRKRGPQFIAIKRRVIETREDWYSIAEPKWYSLWKRVSNSRRQR